MALIGVGLAIAFTAMSGAARIDSKMAGHQAAMILARAKLDEALAHPDFKLAVDQGEDHYAGVDFGYRVVLQPIELLSPEQRARIPSFDQKLERIAIEVFWGAEGAKQSYKLVSYRMVAPNVVKTPAKLGI